MGRARPRSTSCARCVAPPGWTPAEVLLPRGPPPDLEPYRTFFRAPVRFEEETASLVFPARWLDHRIVGADAVFRRMFEERVGELEAVHDGDFQEELRRVLRTQLLTEPPRLQSCLRSTVGR